MFGAGENVYRSFIDASSFSSRAFVLLCSVEESGGGFKAEVDMCCCEALGIGMCNRAGGVYVPVLLRNIFSSPLAKVGETGMM